MTEFNARLMSDVVTWAWESATAPDVAEAEFPEWGKWGQSFWATLSRDGMDGWCGTTYCIAGQAAAQAGYVPVFMVPVVDWFGGNNLIASSCILRAGTEGYVVTDDPDSPFWERAARIDVVAREALGIASDEADRLFEGANRIEKVIGYALAFAERRGATLDLPDDALWAFKEKYGDLATFKEKCHL